MKKILKVGDKKSIVSGSLCIEISEILKKSNTLDKMLIISIIRVDFGSNDEKIFKEE